MKPAISGATVIAGVAGSPVRHSLSPLIHNAWLAGAGIDGVYVAFPLAETGLKALVDGFRGGVIRGLNITVPFKEEALALADQVSDRARRGGRGQSSAVQRGWLGERGQYRWGRPAGGLRRTGSKIRPHRAAGSGPGRRWRGARRGDGPAGGGRAGDSPDQPHPRAGRGHPRRPGRRVIVLEWGELREALIGAGAVINATSLGLDGPRARWRFPWKACRPGRW